MDCAAPDDEGRLSGKALGAEPCRINPPGIVTDDTTLPGDESEPNEPEAGL